MNFINNKRVLIASLMLNLFLVTGIAGAAWRWWNAAAPAQARGLRFAASELAPEQRKAYRMRLRQARGAMGPQVQAARESRQEVLRLMAAQPYDRDAVAAALARARTADLAVRAQVEAAVAEFAAGLSPQDRAKFVQGLERRSSLGGANAPPPRSDG
ncbi:MAG TPA: periplasmic heavy metal sensor [Burkholderiaceae bacterium]